LTGIKKLAVAN